MQSAREFALEDIIDNSRIEELEDDNSGKQFRTEVEVQKPVFHRQGLKKGDVVSLQRVRYTHENLMIWNGNRFIDLQKEIDERGAIPFDFPVITEFPMGYWQRILLYRYGFGFNHGLFLHPIAYSFTPYVEWYMSNTRHAIYYCTGVATMEYNGKGHRVFYHFSSRSRDSWEELRDFLIQWIQSDPIARYQNHVNSLLEDVLKRQPDYEFVEGRDLYVEIRVGEVYLTPLKGRRLLDRTSQTHAT